MTTHALSHSADASLLATAEGPDRFREIVDALTDVASAVGPDRQTVDLAGYLADVLAAVTANVGGVEVLLAGRPGSWEADLVSRLVIGTVGEDEAELRRRRTRPVVVRLHVAELVESHYGYPGWQEAIDGVDERHHALDGAVDSDAYAAGVASVESAWVDAYRAYADAFTRAVYDRAATQTGLTVPVRVEVVADPDAKWWPPHDVDANSDLDGDQMAWQLWDYAASVVPLPVDEHGHLITPARIDPSSPSSTEG